MTGGWTDTSLTELGRKQAELLGEKLKSVLKDNDDGEKFTLYSSDLLRAKQTADIVGTYIGLQVACDRELREVNLGIANGQTKAWAHKHRIPRLSAGFDIDYREYLHAETWRQFYERVCRCMERICAEDANHLIIVTHGGTLGYIIAWWLGFAPEMLEKAYFPTLPGSYSLLHSNGYNQRTLRQLNEASHLDVLRQENRMGKSPKRNGGKDVNSDSCPGEGKAIKPVQSYTIWFSQRTGSTLLNNALNSTGMAGQPNEWLNGKDPLTATQADVERMWTGGTTANGVFGLKTSLKREWIDAFRQLYTLPETATQAEVWQTAFPNCNKHIYMTRRNKVRLAVSWWRAIVSGEWHRASEAKRQESDAEDKREPVDGLVPADRPVPGDQRGLADKGDLVDKYNFDAIRHLYIESSMREAALEEFFTESGIVPLTIVYEDFILDYEGTVRKVLEFLNLPTDNVTIAPPSHDRLADDVSEDWVQRFREEIQQEWKTKAW
jgi:LPS sulfotransferase NodH/broad specificity phosphatase PhoE